MRLRAALNHPKTMPFALAAGKLIQNLGSIEMLSFQWISTLQTDPIVVEICKQMTLRNRIEVICKLLTQSSKVSRDLRQDSLSRWKELIPHTEIRNIVAHSGVAMAFSKEDTTQTPEVIGVMNLKPRNKSKEAELVSVKEINASVNATARLAQQFLELFERLKHEINAKVP